MSSLKTILSFTKNLFTVGSFTETRPKTVAEICSKLKNEPAITVVEFGMGHGNMTKYILDHISDQSTLYAFELNSDFCDHVKNTISDSRLNIINDSALNFKKYIDFPVDNFIVSIPFTFLKDSEATHLTESCFHQLKENGVYSQVVYREKTLLNAINGRSYDKKTVKALINEKIFHVYQN